jgi:hypothetical protein
MLFIKLNKYIFMPEAETKVCELTGGFHIILFVVIGYWFYKYLYLLFIREIGVISSFILF